MRALLAVLLLAGCAHVPILEPALPFPEPPLVTFTVDPQGAVCVSPEDANLLDKWMQKIDQFQTERAKLLKGD